VLSYLRIGGLVLGIGLVLLGGRRLLGRSRGSRAAALAQVAGGLALIVISLEPSVVGPLVTLFGLEDESPSRLLSFLILSMAGSFLLILYALGRADLAGRRIGDLVQALALSEADAELLAARSNGVVAICIPAFDEAPSLPEVLESIPAVVHGRRTLVVVIDDGSRDGTASIAKAGGALVVRHALRLGGGAALVTGYGAAQRVGAEVVVSLDADGQHDPAELDAIAGPILDDRADLVIGSRRLGRQDPGSRLRNTGVTVFSFLGGLLGGQRLTDISNGFRAIRAERLGLMTLREAQFHSAELVLTARAAGLRVLEVPVTVRSRRHGRSKKGGDLRYGAGFLRVLLRSWLR
jgi:hypothetical protein